MGIVVGVGLNLVFILQKSARPGITHEVKKVGDKELVLVVPDQSIFFSASEYFRSHLTKLAHKHSSAEWVVVDGQHINQIDATVASGLKTLNKDFGYLRKTLVFWKWQQQPLGVLYRTNADFLNHFKHSETIDELISELDTSWSNGGATAITVSQ